MKRIAFVLLLSTFFSSTSFAGAEDDPLLTMFKLDQFELSGVSAENDLVWQGQFWLGKDLNKLMLKSEGEYADNKLEQAEVQLLYSRAIASFWDVQLGWRHDIKPAPNRDWLVMGVQGLSPYYFETDIALFFGKHGNIGLRTQFEYEFMLTQKWVLSPEFEANIYSKDDRNIAIGKGLADISIGLRLRYEIEREFAPYIGIETSKYFGNTADFVRSEAGKTSDTRWVAGIKVWF